MVLDCFVKTLSCGVLSVENRSTFLLSVAMGKIALTQAPQMKLPGKIQIKLISKFMSSFITT